MLLASSVKPANKYIVKKKHLVIKWWFIQAYSKMWEVHVEKSHKLCIWLGKLTIIVR